MRCVLTMILGMLTLSPTQGQSFNDYEIDPHRYFDAPLHDPMSVFLNKVKSGEISLEEFEGSALVRRLLDGLSIPVESQVLVFSKTSLQRRSVHPRNPRALYFNEDIYLGWMPNGRVEITSMDPELGGIFYFQRPLDEKRGPLFERSKSCLGCHAGSATNFLPGLLGRSVYSDEDGRNRRSVSSFDRSSHDVPLEDRWGGWYVTGYHGSARHMGNAIASGTGSDLRIDPEPGANLRSLKSYFDTNIHLRGDSDVLALMILDHQISMHHWFMEAHYRVRHGLYQEGIKAVSRHDLRLMHEFDWEGLDQCVDRLIRYMLFADEARWERRPGRVREITEMYFWRTGAAIRKADR